jgi:hypothetical protein
MMKRPRSFILTTHFILFLVVAGLTASRIDSFAGGLPRQMDPRAGDPTEPDDSPLPASNPPDDYEYLPRRAPVGWLDFNWAKGDGFILFSRWWLPGRSSNGWR